METLEFSLIILGCIISSSVISRITSHLALPLVQIAVGFLVALIAPAVVEVQLDSELFLVLFIAPLLFDEARHSNRSTLWKSGGAIFSLAVGLVIATVLIVGYVLNLIIPSIPLAAAFACAAALGPTDAAAVGALGSTVNLKQRQKTLLSGESLINDASGVVSFQFAIAAAVTGTFSVADAASSFAVLFFGGIAFGAVAGLFAQGSMWVLRHFGFEDTITHVIYEVFTPFVVFLIAEAIGVSGILAVVATGLAMTENEPRLISIDAARRQMVSDNFWKVIVYLINGIVFVMLGMQLPLALQPSVAQMFTIPKLLIIVVVLTLLLMAIRFAWLSVMELFHKDSTSGKRGFKSFGQALKAALVMTLAGPKGAVTLSIIFTIPWIKPDGTLFPLRALLIFLTAGVILLTLLLANFVLPLVAPRKDDKDESALSSATIKVLEQTIHELQRRLATGEPAEYIPALRLTQARYQARLTQERENAAECGKCMADLNAEVLRAQQERADQVQRSEHNKFTEAEEIPYYATLRGIRGSVGYLGSAARVGSRFRNLSGKIRLWLHRFRPEQVEDEKSALVYYDTCLFAIDLENTAIAYLRKVAETDPERKHVAETLIAYHEAARNSIWGRLRYGQFEDYEATKDRPGMGPHKNLPEGMKASFVKQFAMARRYADEVDANALIIELDTIRHLQESGEISSKIAHQLRERVYALQGALEGE